MRAAKPFKRFFESLLNQPGPVVRYLLPFVTLAIAITIQAALTQFVPKNVDFPYVFFFLIAVFVTAWVGGYLPGVLTCLIVMVGIPLLATPGFSVSKVDPNRLVLLAGVSALISLVAQSQRKKRDQLREANDELDRRVQVRTQELENEIAQHKRTEQALRESERRVDLALDAAGIGQWDLDLVTGLVTRSSRHQQIIGEVELNPTATRAEFYENVVPEDRPGLEQKLRLAIETGEACEFECRIMQPVGEPRWLWASGKVIRDDQGR